MSSIDQLILSLKKPCNCLTASLDWKQDTFQPIHCPKIISHLEEYKSHLSKQKN